MAKATTPAAAKFAKSFASAAELRRADSRWDIAASFASRARSRPARRRYAVFSRQLPVPRRDRLYRYTRGFHGPRDRGPGR